MKTEGGNSTEDSKYVAYCLATERKKKFPPWYTFQCKEDKTISMWHDGTYVQDNQLHKYMYINI